MILLENNRKNRVNYLKPQIFSSTTDILDERFVKIYRPFRVLQRIMGTCRVNVENRIVSAPTAIQRGFTVIYLVLILYAAIRLMQTYFIKKFVADKLMIMVYTVGVFGFTAVCILNTIHTRFFNNEENVKLYVQMQKIDRMMRMDDRIYTGHYRHNLMVALVITIVFVMLNIVTIILVKGEVGIFEIIGPTTAMASFFVELIYCSNEIIFFSIRVRQINLNITKHITKENKGIKTLSLKCANKNLKPNMWNETRMDFETTKTDIYLNEIFDGFDLFQKLHQFQLFQFCISVIVWIVLPFEFWIRALQKNLNMSFLWLDLLHIVTLLSIQIATIFIVCLRAESFLREVKETKKLCVCVLSRYSNGAIRRKAKSMLNLIQNATPSFSVYGMWFVDARLLLNIFVIVTTALVTVLQLSYI